MKKGDELAACAIEWFFVDQFHARTGGLLELALNVIRGERDVMNATRGIFFQILGDGTFRIGRFEQFKVNVAAIEERGADFLRRHFLAVFAFQTQRFFVIRHGFVERFHGDSQVVNFIDHKVL